jgi:DNA-binding Lrp family transcriptional regulator
MAKVYLIPIYRAAWADMMANDKRLPHVAVRVGIIVGTYFNSGDASTFVGQGTIAKRLSISRRAVTTAIKRLVDTGHLISKRGGRASNTYSMPVENVAAYCAIYTKKMRSDLRNFTEEIAQNDVGNCAAGVTQTLSPSEIDNSTVPNNVSQFKPHGEKWLSVYARLSDHLGTDPARNWFGDLEVVRIADGVCTMLARSKFMANYINNNFYPAMVMAWQCEVAAITRVVVVDRSALPAPHEPDRRELSMQGGAA